MSDSWGSSIQTLFTLFPESLDKKSNHHIFSLTPFFLSQHSTVTSILLPSCYKRSRLISLTHIVVFALKLFFLSTMAKIPKKRPTASPPKKHAFQGQIFLPTTRTNQCRLRPLWRIRFFKSRTLRWCSKLQWQSTWEASYRGNSRIAHTTETKDRPKKFCWVRYQILGYPE